jgi:pimeloyl-ACP methyl ester carboxylesterase
MRKLTKSSATFALLLFAAGALAQKQPEGHTASVNGIEMYYDVSGIGPPLVLLHGFGGSGQDWNSTRGEYANAYRVIVPDLRGHGRSTNPTNQFMHRQPVSSCIGSPRSTFMRCSII